MQVIQLVFYAFSCFARHWSNKWYLERGRDGPQVFRILDLEWNGTQSSWLRTYGNNAVSEGG